MKWIAVSCVVLAVVLQAEPGAGAPQENKSSYLNSAAVFNGAQPVREGTLMFLHDYVKQGDTLLKERLQESFSTLKELLKDGDAHLKERILEGLAQVKEQLKEGDAQQKEELEGDVAWLKEKMAKDDSHLKEELTEGEAKTREELTGQKDAFEELRQSVKQWMQSSSSQMNDLKQQISDFQAQLKSTNDQLQTAQTQLQTNQETLHSTKETLHSTQANLQTTQEKVKSSEEALQKTREQLRDDDQAFTALKTQLQTAEEQIRSLKAEVDGLQSNVRADYPDSSEMTQSTFTRWGRKTCPANTSLVYSGVAGGSWYDHTGGASNYLCLAMDPQLDNMTVPSAVNYLYGSEYEDMGSHNQQDVVCSVCRAPHSTTLMIPATLTCPPGWVTQYGGYLVSGYHAHKGRAEYVCLDKERESRDAGHGNNNGALMYHVVTSCGSLPCPPYVNSRVVTCVVCSR